MSIQGNIQNSGSSRRKLGKWPEHWPGKIGFGCNRPEPTQQTCWDYPSKCQLKSYSLRMGHPEP
jgi:hypothetical protein